MANVTKEQKEVLQSQLDEEKELIRRLKLVYGQAQDDCVNKIIDLARRRDMENLQTIIYQKQYQEVLKKQLDTILDQLHTNEFSSISEYLTKCYEEGFIGTMYDIAGQGIPFIIPIDQKQVVRAVQLDSKLKESLYKSLGEDVTELKKAVRHEVARGIANGSSWLDVGEKLSKNMKHTPFNKAINNSIRIARTEGHRIQNQAALDAQYKAKEKGADVVKQWDSTLDGRTRYTHRLLDGQLRELEEPFEVSGKKADAPGLFGDPGEDCNCRCALLQRARWALDDDETFTKWDDINKELLTLNSKNYEQFKEAYQDMVDKNQTINQITNNLYDEAKRNEPQITVDLKDIVENATNGTIAYKLGEDKTTLDYRLKSEESIKRKVTSDFVNGKKLSNIEKETYDCVRYTDIVAGNYFVGDYIKVNEALENKGYKIVRVKNTFINENAAYKGLNTVVETPSGYKFELQFHTPKSLEVKEKNHVLYEKQRQDGISAAEYQKITMEMLANSKTISAIPNAENIQSFDNLK